MNQLKPWILPVIVFSQFAGTSLWFAGNAVIGDLQRDWGLPTDSLGLVTSSVQAGFITGTLCFALVNLADRFSPRLVFFTCSVLGASANLLIYYFPGGLSWLIACRFLTGFFLAGIYPVGMKIAASWYRRGLGQAIGFLVGALVMGTAFPHLIKALGGSLSWSAVLLAVSAVSFTGGLTMLAFVPDGPYLPKGGAFRPSAVIEIFRVPEFRAAAFGYFGHMWELYAWWAFVPVILASRPESVTQLLHVPLWSFLVIAVGSLGCAVGGRMSLKKGSAPVAYGFLAVSCLCCLVSPLMYRTTLPIYLGFLLVWGIAVIGDSPQFSALNARTAPKRWVGTSLTTATCLGFALTIASIQLLNALQKILDPQWLFLPLAIGPFLGMIFTRPLLAKNLEVQPPQKSVTGRN